MGPQAHDFLRQVDSGVHVVALAETHVPEEAIPGWRGKLQADGWRLAATPAVSTGRSAQGVHGGEWALARLSVAATTFEGQRRIWKQHGTDLFWDFALLLCICVQGI